MSLCQFWQALTEIGAEGVSALMDDAQTHECSRIQMSQFSLP
jgi:hypothetical protein